VKTLYLESVPYGKQMLNDWNQLVSRGVNAIVDTSAAGQPFVNFCKAHPTLVCATTYPPLGPEPKNVSNFYVAHWLGSYLVGVAAGKLTKKGTVGYVAPFKVPTVNASVNAFALGCRSVRKDCTVKTVLTNSWYDPPKETEAAQSLINGGADVLMQNTDSSAVLQTAEKAGKYAFGWDSDMTAYGPKAHLASAIINWTPYYTKATRDVLDGTWKTGQAWWGVKEGAIDIVSISDKVPAELKDKVLKVKAGLKDGTYTIWKGPLVANDGKEMLKKDEVADDKFLGGINFFVKGVEGKVPGADKK
jgi:simple sugar transport system substrate-binding protein